MASSSAKPTVSGGRRAVGLAVHAFTASGAVVGIAALLAAARGQSRSAALLMLAALAIDSVDGTLARRAEVGRTVPWIDGRRLDDVVDFLNYVVVPLVFLALSGLLPVGAWGGAAVVGPVFASAFGFSNRNAKTPDHFFLGFPSYWNVVAIYLWLLAPPPAWSAGLLLALAIGVFVPVRYLYPSQAPRWRRTSVGLGVFWFAILCAAVASREPEWIRALTFGSLFYPAYYLVLSALLRPPQRGATRG